MRVNESCVLIYSGVSALKACCVLSIFDNSSSILLEKCLETLVQPSCIEEKYGIFSILGLMREFTMVNMCLLSEFCSLFL